MVEDQITIFKKKKEQFDHSIELQVSHVELSKLQNLIKERPTENTSSNLNTLCGYCGPLKP